MILQAVKNTKFRIKSHLFGVFYAKN